MTDIIDEYRSGRIVLPGEKLCISEEFMPGPGAYERNGTVYSKYVGTVLYDYCSRRVSVVPSPYKMSLIPRPGKIVWGQVYSVSDEIAIIRIFKIEGTRPLSGTFTGLVHVSQISENYVKVVEDALKLGDYIRAKVLTSWSPYQLTTKNATLGVILAYCSKCGKPLWRKNMTLYCKACGNTEKRKISVKYMLSE